MCKCLICYLLYIYIAFLCFKMKIKCRLWSSCYINHIIHCLQSPKFHQPLRQQENLRLLQQRHLYKHINTHRLFGTSDARDWRWNKLHPWDFILHLQIRLRQLWRRPLCQGLQILESRHFTWVWCIKYCWNFQNQCFRKDAQSFFESALAV